VTPTRIQRKRTKGWRSPPGTVHCSRPSKYGNPFRVLCDERSWFVSDGNFRVDCGSESAARSAACRMYRVWLLNDGSQPGQDRKAGGESTLERARKELRDAKHLSCWCPLHKQCHVDVLIDLLDPRGESDG